MNEKNLPKDSSSDVPNTGTGDAVEAWLNGHRLDQTTENPEDITEPALQFATDAEIEKYATEPLFVQLDIELEEGQKGTLEFNNNDTIIVTMPFVGYEKSKTRVRGKIGWQMIHFSKTEFKQFLHFVFNQVPFKVTHPFGSNTRFEINGVVEALTDDFMPIPRFQVDEVELDYDSNNQLIESERRVMYFEVSQKTRENIKSAYDAELSKRH